MATQTKRVQRTGPRPVDPGLDVVEEPGLPLEGEEMADARDEPEELVRPSFEIYDNPETLERTAKVYTIFGYKVGPDGPPQREFTLREPAAGRLEQIDRSKGQVEGFNRVLAVVSGIPYGTIRSRMKVRDWNTFAEAMGELGFAER